MNQEAQQSWSIVILCYNEAGSIAKVIKESHNLLSHISLPEGEIIVINDGSEDESDAIIQQIIEKKEYKNLLYKRHTTNKGIGEALRSGYSLATKENVVMISGDGQFDGKELIPYKNIPQEHFLSFYRLENTTYSLQRKLLSQINRYWNKFFVGIDLKDVNWTSAYKTKTLKQLELKLRSSLIESEISAKLLLLGHKALEIESKYLPNTSGESTGASFKIIWQAAKDSLLLIKACQSFKRKHKKKTKMIVNVISIIAIWANFVV